MQGEHLGMLLRGLGRKGRSKKVHSIDHWAHTYWKERVDGRGRDMEGKPESI